MRILEGPRALLGRRLVRWLYTDRRARGAPGADGGGPAQGEHTHPWWQVMCLTGLDYFSTLGYQPGIAFLAAGALSPLATLCLVLLTLFGALPVYRRVARESPHGEGSIAMLEHLLPRWKGKLFVLCLLGFMATDFIITITLSAADATAHLIENPFVPRIFQHRLGVTLILIVVLGAVFLKGFREAIGIATAVVAIYLALNALVIGVALVELAHHPERFPGWRRAVWTAGHSSPLGIALAALLVFPKLALGLSGFETGVAVMPLVRGEPDDSRARPEGRIRNTRTLLVTAAAIMSVLLIASSLATAVLIPAEEFRPAQGDQLAGKANGRALAYLAHRYLGELVGTVYDVSTILILWFAGASAMAGLLSVMPRYLPRYGMAPEWAGLRRPLTLVFTGVAVLVTLIFRADVDAQGGAYATGVLALMTSAAVAVALSAWRARERLRWAFVAVALVFVYTTVDNVIERPEGVKIATCFIVAIVVASLASRAERSTELRITRVEVDTLAARFLQEAAQHGDVRIIANHRDAGDAEEYAVEGAEKRADHHLPPDAPVLFLEVEVQDASEFSSVMRVRGVEVGGHRVLRAEAPAVPNAIAALLLRVRDRTGHRPHVYFGWTEGNPFLYLLKYVAFGQGAIAQMTREILRQAEHDPEKRPVVHVG